MQQKTERDTIIKVKKKSPTKLQVRALHISYGFVWGTRSSTRGHDMILMALTMEMYGKMRRRVGNFRRGVMCCTSGPRARVFYKGWEVNKRRGGYVNLESIRAPGQCVIESRD